MLKKLTKSPNFPYMALFLVLGVAVCVLIYATDGTPTRNSRDWSVWHNDFLTGVIDAITACGLAIIVAVRRFKPSLITPRNEKIVKVLAAALVIGAGVTYFYSSRALAKIRYPKTWDSYHYLLGPKYFEEVGYNDLYKCHLIADSQRRIPHYSPQDTVRDLDSYKIVSVRDLLEDAECPRFSEDRWREFKADTRFFDRYNIKRVIRDHGYNGTPLQIVLAGSIAQIPEVTWRNLVLLSYIDILGISLLLAVVAWAFGWKVGFLFALFFFTNFADRFTYIGASYFRYIWMICFGISLALLWRKVYSGAAVFLVAASMLNVFPLLYFSGIGIKVIADLWKKRSLRPEHKVFIKWAVIATILIGGVSLLNSSPVQNYRTFFSNMSQHSGLLTKSRIGFQYMFLYRGDYSEDVPRYLYERKSREFNNIRTPYSILVILVLFLGMSISRKMDDFRATILMGFLLFFMLLSTVEYYYASAACLVLFWAGDIEKRRGKIFLSALFALMAVVYVIWDQTRFLQFANNQLMGALFTSYLGAMLLYFAIKYKILWGEEKPEKEKPSALGRALGSLLEKARGISMPLKVAGLAGIVGLVGGGLWLANREEPVVQRPHSGPYYTLFASGDAVLARRMHHHFYQHGADRPFEEIAEIVEEADIAMTNLENVIATRGDLYPKENRNPFYFRGRPELLDILVRAGFDFVTTGNNHSMDYGPEALAEQSEILSAAGIAHAGAGEDIEAASSPTYVKTGDVTLAFISAFIGEDDVGAERAKAGVFRIKSNGDVLDAIRGPYEEARANSDIVVFSPHWGRNLRQHPTRSRVNLAHDLIELGFDAILGHSAHLIQGVEVYRGRPIVYDMGTILADWATPRRMKRQAAFLLEFNKSGFTKLRVIPLELDYGRTRLAFDEEAEEVRGIIEEGSSKLNGDVRFERDEEDLVIALWPPERGPARRGEPGKVHISGSTEAVPERFVKRRSNVFLEQAPDYTRGFSRVALQQGADVIGAKSVDVVRSGSGFVVEVALEVREQMKGRWDGVVIARKRGGEGEHVYPHPIAHGAADPARWSKGDIVIDRVCVRQIEAFEPGTYDLYWAMRDRDSRDWNYAQAEGARPRPLEIGSILVEAEGVPRHAAGIDWDGLRE